MTVKTLLEETSSPDSLSAVFKPEYLAAIALKVNRTKDKLKAELLLDQSSLDEKKLNEILRTHGIERTI